MVSVLHQFIDRAAEKAPDHPAFVCRGKILTYGELADRSNQLARLLRERGVKSMDRVGIYLNKSLEIPIAVYGILKAGAAYVPIDPAAPIKRVAFILRDCGIEHLVTQPTRKRSVREICQAGSILKGIYGLSSDDLEGLEPVSFAWDMIGQLETVAPDVKVTDQDLAYIMYTSGSTGSPKGLMHTHLSGSSYAHYSGAIYDVQPEDRLGNHSHLHFDMSTFEYFTGPSRGATSVIITEEEMMFPVQLGKVIEDQRLTFWYSVPLALIQLISTKQAFERDLSCLRWVLFGGEVFPRKYLSQLQKAWPGARFSNVYGPAEVNQCTYYHVPRNEQEESIPVPLGHVWAGAESIILNEQDGISAPGEVGELLIRSSTMMRGYWGQPDLSRARLYVHEPFQGFRKIYYRTGDLVSQDPDGLLHFHGRKDLQVKIRGHRLELGEVEEVIASMEKVIEAAVLCLPSEKGENALTAVVLHAIGDAPEESPIRQAVAKQLPPYAVPARFVFKDQLPRTTSGKIDRLALARLLQMDNGEQ